MDNKGVSELSNRQCQILKLLLTKEERMTSGSLASKYDVSCRTIRYDLDNLDYYLKPYEIVLERNRSYGLRLQGNLEHQQKLLELLRSEILYVTFPYLLSIEFLLYQTVTLMELADRFEVSKNKLTHTLPEVENILNQAGLTLNKRPAVGMSLVGSESQIRLAIFKMNQGATEELRDYFFKKLQAEESDKIFEFVEKYQNITGIHFSDRGSKELILTLCYQQLRMSQGFVISYENDEMMQAILGEELELILGIFKDLGLELPVEEGIFTLKQIRNTQVIHLPSHGNNCDGCELTRKLIMLSEEHLGIDLTPNESALQLHLKVALHRLRTGQIIENPLTEQIQYRYRFIFETVKKMMVELEWEYGLNFPDDEIAYLTMHIGACFEMSDQVGYMPRAVVICNSGLATSTLLATRLKVMLPEMKILGPIGVSELTDELIAKVDLVISTVEFSIAGKEVVVVNPLLDIEDMVQLKKQIFTLTSKKQLTHLVSKGSQPGQVLMSDLVSKARIQLREEVEGWRQGIRLAAEPLVMESYVTKPYVDAMIQAVEELGPYMVFIPEVALVHASPKNGVIKEGISILTLKEPLVLGDKNGVRVSCFIVLVTLKKDCQLFLNLIQILDNPENVQLLLKSSSITEVLQLSNQEECRKDEDTKC